MARVRILAFGFAVLDIAAGVAGMHATTITDRRQASRHAALLRSAHTDPRLSGGRIPGMMINMESNGGLHPVLSSHHVLPQAAHGTSISIINSISPTTITANATADITLIGTASMGDQVIWATDCAMAKPNANLTQGTDKSTSFSAANFSAAGDYKLCYRASGHADSVEQTGITLTVQAEALTCAACKQCNQAGVTAGCGCLTVVEFDQHTRLNGTALELSCLTNCPDIPTAPAACSLMSCSCDQLVNWNNTHTPLAPATTNTQTWSVNAADVNAAEGGIHPGHSTDLITHTGANR